MKKQEALDLIQKTIGNLDPSMRTANGGRFEAHRNDDIEVRVINGSKKSTEKIEDWRVHWVGEDGELKSIYDEMSSTWKAPEQNAQYMAAQEPLVIEEE
jgi:hypothetical protein